MTSPGHPRRLERALLVAALVVLLASLVTTGVVVWRLLEYEEWLKVPPRLAPEEEERSWRSLSSCGRDLNLKTLLLNDTLWVVCGPHEGGDPNGGLARLDLEARTFRMRWPITDGQHALFEVVAFSATPQGELAIVYRSGPITRTGGGSTQRQRQVSVAIAGPDGWVREPETLVERLDNVLGIAWVDDHLEVVLGSSLSHASSLDVVRVARRGAVTRSPMARDAVCQGFKPQLCSLRAAYHHGGHWRFAVSGVHRTPTPSGDTPPALWDVRADGSGATPHHGLTVERSTLDRAMTGVVERGFGPDDIALDPDGQWSPVPRAPAPEGVKAMPHPGHFRWETDHPVRHPVWSARDPSRPGQEIIWHRRHGDTWLELGYPGDLHSDLLPQILVNHAPLAQARWGGDHELRFGHLIERPEGYILSSGQASYLALNEDLSLSEPRGSFAYLHQVQPENAYGIYGILFGLFPLGVLCFGLLGVSERARHATRRVRLLLCAIIAGVIHAGVAIVWLASDLWQWLR